MGEREGEKVIFFQSWLDRIEKLGLMKEQEDYLIGKIVRMGEREGVGRKEIEEVLQELEERYASR